MNSKFTSRLVRRLLLAVITLAPSFVLAREWQVSAAGNDSHDCASSVTALRSLQKAADLVAPGDIVLVGDGTYTPPPSASRAVLRLTRSGRPEAWITWRAAPGARPEIRFEGWAGIEITASYQIIEGFSVVGSNDSLTLLDALADAKNPRPNPRFNGNGITIDGRKSAPDAKPHRASASARSSSTQPGWNIPDAHDDSPVSRPRDPIRDAPVT